MPVIDLTLTVRAPAQRVFDLSRSIDLHVESTAQTAERAVAGRTSGLICLGEEVTWEATHFGIKQRLTTQIVAFDAPHHFRDTMVRGTFQRFDHDHYFESDGDHTRMRDVFDYTSPLGVLGRMADVLFLEAYMRRFLQTRNELIKSVAESSRLVGSPDG